MIPRNSKFPLRTDFVRFRARSQKHVTSLTTIYHLPSTVNSRLAVIIPKKANKLATVRNALKRLTYDTLWPLIKNTKADCVIVYKPLPLSRAQLNQELTNELSQAIRNI